ncbi:glycosyltransferase family 4 protein [Enterococcus raffinosus]|uniref:glycosyltransferase family 4 protein n=1 Tax=Enterococcus raffinosus TaxID=71452 RepID=UPI001C128B8D|nr:glycosyltransferase family 4 protein [Enterococcus raffinosus]MBU5360859.1 glycosyltransferase family 4 protein [Enterococcus raffinosus]
MKKILIVSNMYPSSEYPHYGVFVKNTEDILIEDGFLVDRSVMYKQVGIIKKILSYSSFYIRTICMMVFSKYDFIYVHFASLSSVPVLFANKLSSSKIVVNVHGNDLIPETKKDEKYRKIVQKILNVSEMIISPSQYFTNVIINDFHISEEKIVDFPSGGVNNNIFYPMDKKEAISKMKLDDSKFYLGFISRLEANKGWDTFLRAYKKILEREPSKNIEIVVVGDGNDKTAFLSLLNELSISSRVHYYPLLGQNEINVILNCIDVFCFPTNRKSESLGLIGLEAMATRTLVVANNSFGPSSYMESGKNGICFNENDPDVLYEAIIRAMNLSKTERESFLSNAFKTSHEYSVSNQKKYLIDVFK